MEVAKPIGENVESLALVVAIIVYSCVLSGPLTLLLSSRFLKRATEHVVLKIGRRLIMGIVNFFGISISVFFLTGPFPFALKSIAFISFLLNAWALDREYGGNLTQWIKNKIKRNPNGPVGQS